ncbi:hypothetical protein MN116_008814, partial [Schistosoma mekongi]
MPTTGKHKILQESSSYSSYGKLIVKIGYQRTSLYVDVQRATNLVTLDSNVVQMVRRSLRDLKVIVSESRIHSGSKVYQIHSSLWNYYLNTYFQKLKCLYVQKLSRIQMILCLMNILN